MKQAYVAKKQSELYPLECLTVTVGSPAKTAWAEADAEGSTEGAALCARVQGMQYPCAGQGRQPLPREVMLASLHTGYCLTLKSAGLAVKLPFSHKRGLEENERKCLVPCVQEDRHFPLEKKRKKGGKWRLNETDKA